MRTAVLGGFDGIHLGHQALIGRAGSRPVVLCMEPLPRQITGGGRWARRLTTPGERRKALHELGILTMIPLPFHGGLMASAPEAFAGLLREIGDFQRILVGWDFRYGHQRRGDAETLASSLPEVEVVVVPPFCWKGSPVKSQGIRDLIGSGDLNEASGMLGRRYGCLGVVVRGKGRGQTLGFPTMNVAVPRCKLLPPPGSYAVRVALGGEAMAGAAFRQPGRPCVEVHVPGFQDETYGHVAEVVFLKGLRQPEARPRDARLKDLIKMDVQNAMEVADTWQ